MVIHKVLSEINLSTLYFQQHSRKSLVVYRISTRACHPLLAARERGSTPRQGVLYFFFSQLFALHQ